MTAIRLFNAAFGAGNVLVALIQIQQAAPHGLWWLAASAFVGGANIAIAMGI